MITLDTPVNFDDIALAASFFPEISPPPQDQFWRDTARVLLEDVLSVVSTDASEMQTWRQVRKIACEITAADLFDVLSLHGMRSKYYFDEYSAAGASIRVMLANLLPRE